MSHILVVDDEPDIIRIVARTLEARGHRVTSARDGIEALGVLHRDRPDLVLLDLDLPHLDGREVCRRLKQDHATASIPIVMMTAAYPSLEDARRGIELGAAEYVVKPFVRDLLIANVERTLARAAATGAAT